MTGRYILNWQLRTPSVSRSQAGAFYINTAEKWISRIMMWSWGMTSAKGSVFLFENVSLKRYYLQVDCASISEIAPAGKPILLRYWRNSNMLVSQQSLAMFTGIMHKKKKQNMLLWRGLRGMAFCWLWSLEKEVSGIITSFCDCTDLPQQHRLTGDD